MTILREVTSEKGVSVDCDQSKKVLDRTGWLCPKCRTAVNPEAQVCPICNEVHVSTELYAGQGGRQVLLG